MAQFWGAPAMALLTVGAGTLILGQPLIGAAAVGGTCVTGTIALAARSHAGVLEAASVVLYGLLVFAWVVVGARTVSGAASGRLFAPGAAISSALST
jgi:hypothetical protein